MTSTFSSDIAHAVSLGGRSAEDAEMRRFAASSALVAALAEEALELPG